MRLLSTLAAALLLAAPAAAQPPKMPAWFAKAVDKVEATIDPPAAKPGQTVTYKLTLKLNEGYITYPSKQADKAAAGYVTVFKFPTDGPVAFVGAIDDPADLLEKAEPEAMITRLQYATGTVVYTRKAVVLPTAKAGAVVVKPTVKLTICDAKNCYLAPPLTPEAALTVLDGPPVAVDAKYADEVKKATGP